MDGISNSEQVICCFCGESLNMEDAMMLIVYSNINNEEGQQLFCHKEHFIEKLDKSIIIPILETEE